MHNDMSIVIAIRMKYPDFYTAMKACVDKGVPESMINMSIDTIFISQKDRDAARIVLRWLISQRNARNN